MKLFSKDKNLYKSFFGIWRMLVLNNVITLGVNLADNIMLGRFSEPALSGVTACNQLQFIFSQLIQGAGVTAVAVCSQYWGEGKTERIKKFSFGAFILCIFFSAVFFLSTAIFPQHVVGIFTNQQSYISEGVKYLRIIKYTYLVFALTNAFLFILRSVESVKIAFWVSVSTLFTNIGLNYVLIFGKLGFPSLGVEGAAYATLIARIFELVLVVIYIAFIDKKMKWRFSDIKLFDISEVKRYLKTCIPFVGADGLFGVSTALQTVILGHMSGPAIAANSISSTLYQLLKVASVGSAGASSVIIGKTIGEGRTDKLKEYVRTLQVIFLIIGVCTAVLLFALRLPIISFYTNVTKEARQLAEQFLLILCLVIMGMSYQMPTNTGIVRGGGDSKYVLIMDLISIWGIVLPVSFLAAFVWNWHPVAVIACLNADQIFKCIPAVIKVNRFRWVKKLTV